MQEVSLYVKEFYICNNEFKGTWNNKKTKTTSKGQSLTEEEKPSGLHRFMEELTFITVYFPVKL